jgi:hypothetical protein
MRRLSAPLLMAFLSAPALAQPPVAERWVSQTTPEDCLVSLRDASPVWRVRLDILRRPQGRVVVFIGVNDPAARAPRPGEDRLRVAWAGPDGEERAFDLPLAGAREASPGRPMVAHSLIAPGSGLDALLVQAREARSVSLSLPAAGPYRIPAAGFTEAWNATEGCAARG